MLTEARNQQKRGENKNKTQILSSQHKLSEHKELEAEILMTYFISSLATF